MAVLFEEKGRTREAASLYRRLLAGRLAVHGPDHADVLMTMQELGSINNKLGNTAAARLLLEKAYIGYENLAKPDSRMALLTLNNLAGVYGTLQMRSNAFALLEPAISRLRQTLGLEDPVACYAICNLLLSTQGPRVPDEVVEAIKELEEQKKSEPGMSTLSCYGDFLASRRHFHEATRIHRVVYEWRKAHSSGLDDETLRSLHRLAKCLVRLQHLDEAQESFDQLARLTASLPRYESWHAIANQEANRVRRAITMQRNEAARWGLHNQGRCSCGTATSRVCSGT